LLRRWEFSGPHGDDPAGLLRPAKAGLLSLAAVESWAGLPARRAPTTVQLDPAPEPGDLYQQSIAACCNCSNVEPVVFPSPFLDFPRRDRDELKTGRPAPPKPS
jgi:hypothetical protein